jgi:hypothetical protein
MWSYGWWQGLLAKSSRTRIQSELAHLVHVIHLSVSMISSPLQVMCLMKSPDFFLCLKSDIQSHASYALNLIFYECSITRMNKFTSSLLYIILLKSIKRGHFLARLWFGVAQLPPLAIPMPSRFRAARWDRETFLHGNHRSPG